MLFLKSSETSLKLLKLEESNKDSVDNSVESQNDAAFSQPGLTYYSFEEKLV